MINGPWFTVVGSPGLLRTFSRSEPQPNAGVPASQPEMKGDAERWWGIWPCQLEGTNQPWAPSMLITGPPGSGKSTLAMELALRLRKATADTLERSRVVYAGTEQRAENLKAMLDRCSEMSGLPPNMGAHTVLLPNESDKLRKDMVFAWNAGTQNCNLVLLPYLSPRWTVQCQDTGRSPDTAFWDHLEELRHIIDTYKVDGERIDVIIIDSLDTLGDAAITRQEVEHFYRLCQDNGIFGIVIAEHAHVDLLRSHEHDAAVSESLAYCADIVVQLGWVSECDYRFRTLEVVKSRDSLHLLGPQKFKMPDLGGRTLTVYPQVHSWFTRYATVNPCRPAPAAPLLIGATDPDLRVALASSALKSLQDQASELGRLPHPIAVALAGEVNTYKVTMAKAFLRAGLHGPVDPGTRGAIILGRIPSGFEPITSGGRVSDGQKKVEGELDGHPALLLTEGFLLPEEALTYVHNWIGERQHKPDRIAVIGLGDLGSSYPLIMQHVAQRGPFITALLRCFRAHGAHAMFVCTTDGEDSQKVFEQVRSICDGIVETKRDDDGTVSAIYYGTGAREPERITLSRRRSFVRRPGRRRCAIRRTPDHRT